MRESKDLYAAARVIGFSRREIFKFGALAASAAFVSACGGGGSGDSGAVSGPIAQFAKGTWRVDFTYPQPDSSRNETNSQMYKIGNGTFEMTVAGDAPPFLGTWRFSDGRVDVSFNGFSGVASGVPEVMTSAAFIDWRWNGQPDSGPQQLGIPAKWDRSSQTLTMELVGATEIPFSVTAVKT